MAEQFDIVHVHYLEVTPFGGIVRAAIGLLLLAIAAATVLPALAADTGTDASTAGSVEKTFDSLLDSSPGQPTAPAAAESGPATAEPAPARHGDLSSAGAPLPPATDRLARPAFFQPGSSFPQPGTSFAQPGSSFPQPGTSFAQPGTSFPQPGPAFDVLGQALPNFHVVTPTLLRGGQPDDQGLSALRRAGVRTIVDLRNEDILVKQEAAAARAAGLNFVSLPLDVFNSPSDTCIASFLSIVDGAQQPVYVHCLHGQDRTGTMVAIYRIERQGWTANKAYEEMLAYGFRPGFSRLTQAVFARGGQPMPSGGDIVRALKQRFSDSGLNRR
jgi:protein tyrosine phosphatase (PTP) superfamily phosphohydrolase (DUF442 family)